MDKSGKKKKRQIFNIKNKKGSITSDINRITREYYEQRYANKFENLDEMDKFLEEYELLKLT